MATTTQESSKGMKCVRNTLDKLSVVSQEKFKREMAEVKKRLESLVNAN
jgi:hypothetical protein